MGYSPWGRKESDMNKQYHHLPPLCERYPWAQGSCWNGVGGWFSKAPTPNSPLNAKVILPCFEKAPGVGDGQGGLACCSPQGCT